MTPEERDRLTRNENNLSHMARAIEQMTLEMQAVRRESRELREAFQMVTNQTKGGLRVALAIGSLSGLVGAGMVKIIPWFNGIPK